jgi:SAM-dependent methyltransferase
VPDNKSHYDSYYHGAPRELEWRPLGAVDKAGNVARLAEGHAVGSILELGCGDGAVLARLSEFGTSYVGA